jgi:hypothetical protein
MTTLLPSFPMLSDVDAKLLRIFHRMESIPIAAAQWSKKMKDGQFVISVDLLTEIQNFISDSSVLPDEIVAELRTDPSSDSARYRFTRNLSLYVALIGLDSQTRFAEDYPEEAAAFEKTMASYFAQSAGFFALTKQVALQKLDPLPEPLKNARDGYKSLCNDVYKSLCNDVYDEIRMMLARIILYSSNGQYDVGLRLSGLGFTIEFPQEIRVSANVLVLDAIGVVALFAVATLAAAGSGMTTGPTLIIGSLVAVNHSIAAVGPSSFGVSPISATCRNDRSSRTWSLRYARLPFAYR